MATNNKDRKNIITAEGRVSFPCVFAPSSYSRKYEMALVFPKGTDLSALQAEAKRVAVEKFGQNIKGLRSPFRKCSEKMETYGEFDPDSVFITFRTKQQPGLVDAAKQPIIAQNEFYAGCWARVSCRAYAYENKGNRGVAFGLQNIQKTRDDDPLTGSGLKAEDEFEAFAGSSEDPAAYNRAADEDIFGAGPAADSGDPFPF